MADFPEPLFCELQTQPPGRVFVFQHGFGSETTVEGVASVHFEPHHVVFRDGAGRILLAKVATHVLELREVIERG